MKKSRFTEEKIVYAVKQSEPRVPIVELYRTCGGSPATLYRWRKMCGGLSSSEYERLKEREGENRRLEQLVTDLSLDKQILQDVLSKKDEGRHGGGRSRSAS